MQPGDAQSAGQGYRHYNMEEIRELVNKTPITTQEMRDAVISCTIDMKTSDIKRNPDPKISKTPAETIAAQGYSLIMNAFNTLDIPYADPSPEEMSEVLLEVAKTWKLDEMQRDLAQSHRFICQQLMSKIIRQREGL